MRIIKILVASFLFTTGFQASAEERWFNQDVVDYGNGIFQQNCALCHGSNAEGTRDWKKTDANGNYPPPPLDGSAHAWHHPLAQLARSIKEGGIKLGGVMPPFGDKLTDQEVLAAIAFFQSKWSDEIYAGWHQRFMQ